MFIPDNLSASHLILLPVSHGGEGYRPRGGAQRIRSNRAVLEGQGQVDTQGFAQRLWEEAFGNGPMHPQIK